MKKALILLCAVAASAVLSAQQPDRKLPPPIGPAPSLKLPAIQKHKLSNGLAVWLVEHHFRENRSHMPCNDVVLGALSQITKNIKLGFGVALMRLQLGAAWLDSGRLVRLSERSVPSPHHYFLCWKAGTLDRWECAAFVEWLKQAT